MEIRWLRWLLLVILGLGLAQPRPTAALGQTTAVLGGGPQVLFELRHDRSLPLRDLPPAALTAAPPAELSRLPLAKTLAPAPAAPADSANGLLPSTLLTGIMPAPLLHFDGVAQSLTALKVVPPDTNGDVGPNHYMQWVNLSFAIWDKSGNLLYGPVPGNTLWDRFGGACQQRNDGDPIVLYDSLADRWLVSQFVVPSGGPYLQCVAVSATPDPTGAWNSYAFEWSQTKMNDYPKFGVWPDGYYLSVNQFDGSQWGGAGVAVLERERMLQNLPARVIRFDLLAANPNFGGMLPADLDGRQAPPPGAPNPFVEWDDGTVFGGSDALRLWEFHADWGNPSLSTFGNNLQPNQVIATANVEPHFNNTYWIRQPGATPYLDAISDRLMYRLQYRNFGDHQALVTNHTVDVGASHGGIHWFELRKTAALDWSLHQEGLHAPDASNRWMGSIALDGAGNMALGYSVSSATLYPSIAYAGRLAGDPLNSLTQAETLLLAGGGSQSGANRWGDYSMLAVDPLDECTFWYTQEYYASTSPLNWRTHIGAFRFPSCIQPATGLLEGTVRSGGQPLSGALVDVAGSTAYSGADGTYMLLLPPGAQSGSVSAFAYQSQTFSTTIEQGGTTLLDFDLTAIALVAVSGTVSDGSGHPGMPLYARIDLAGVPASPIFSDPLTGHYQISLPQGLTYTFNVSAVKGGYLPASRAVLVSGANEDFALNIDPAACPPGYQQRTGACLALPGGLVVGSVRDANQPPNLAPKPLPGAVVVNSTNGGAVSAGADPAGLYFLFGPAGSNQLYAAYPRYATLTQSVNIAADGAVAANFDLPAGYLRAQPAAQALSVTLNRLAPLAQFNLQISNLGSAPGMFLISEFSGTPPVVQATGPFAAAGRRLSPKRTGELTAANIYEYDPPPAAAWPGAGALLRAWSTGAIAPWGLAVAPDGAVWVGDSAAAGHNYPFSATGDPLAGRVSTGWGGAFAADLAYDAPRARFWQVNAGGDNCIYALDAQTGATGERICPLLGNAQRGLAYDPRSQTFYSGSWNDAILVHFDCAGTLLDTVNLGINIAGLAFHPGSGRLFALSNAASGYDVYVYDTRQQYALLGGFDLPGMTDYGQAGLELATDGSLWAVDFQAHQVLQVTSGEMPYAVPEDIPWLSTSPAAASLLPTAQQGVSITIDATGLAPNVYYAYLSISTDTPYDGTAFQIPAVPVQLTVVAAPWLNYFPVVGR